jgi:ribosomal RNA-processing protein 36
MDGSDWGIDPYSESWIENEVEAPENDTSEDEDDESEDDESEDDESEDDESEDDSDDDSEDASDKEEESERDEDDVQKGMPPIDLVNVPELADIDFATLARAQKALAKQTKPTSHAPKSKHTELKSSKPTPSHAVSKTKPKSGPQEVSSKKPVSRKRTLASIQPQRHQRRDPRFDTLTNPVDQQSFRAAYTFLEDYQRDEISLLKTQIKQSKDVNEREKLEKALKSLQSRKDSRIAKDRAQEVLNARKREEKEKVKQGKQPYYLKKSTLL